MNNKQNLAEQLSCLVAKAGSQRKAMALIESVRGTAPTQSAIDRAVKGAGTTYAMHCMISDLKEGITMQQMNKRDIKHFFAEWKHPEHKGWVRIHQEIPAPSQKALVDELTFNPATFDDLDAEFKRLSHIQTQWRAIPSQTYTLSVVETENGFEFDLADGSHWTYETCSDEAFYDWMIAKVFKKDWL